MRHIRTLIEDGQARGEIKDIPGTVLTAFFFPPMVSMLKQANAGRDWTAPEIDMAIETAWDSWRLNR